MHWFLPAAVILTTSTRDHVRLWEFLVQGMENDFASEYMYSLSKAQKADKRDGWKVVEVFIQFYLTEMSKMDEQIARIRPLLRQAVTDLMAETNERQRKDILKNLAVRNKGNRDAKGELESIYIDAKLKYERSIGGRLKAFWNQDVRGFLNRDRKKKPISGEEKNRGVEIHIKNKKLGQGPGKNNARRK
jgi:hypothetical protein